VFFFASIAYTTISHSSTSIKNIQPLHSPGEWRVVTPAGIARVRRPHRVGFSRRLRPCPRKASTRSDPGRREMHVLIEKNQHLRHSLYQLRGGARYRSPSPKTYKKALYKHAQD